MISSLSFSCFARQNVSNTYQKFTPSLTKVTALPKVSDANSTHELLEPEHVPSSSILSPPWVLTVIGCDVKPKATVPMIVIIFPALLFAGGSVTLPGEPTLALELLTRIMTFVDVPAMVLPFASTD